VVRFQLRIHIFTATLCEFLAGIRYCEYGITRQEVEGVPELDWLRTLLSRGCPLDAFGYLGEYDYPEKLFKFVERRDSNYDEFRLRTFQFDPTSA
jgi:hypothetical protein